MTEAVEKLIESGDKYLKKADHLEARHYFEEAIKHYPENITAYLRMGSLSLLLNNLKDANNFFTHAYDINGKSIDALLGLVQTQLKRHGFSRAETHIDRAVVLEPENPQVLFHAGLVKLAMHKLFYAEQHMTLALEKAPKDLIPIIHFYLGIITAQKGLFQRALEHFFNAQTSPLFQKESSPYFLPLKNNTALMHFRLGAFDKAEQQLTELLKSLKSPPPSVLLNLAMVYWSQDKIEQVKSTLETVHNLDPKLWPWMNELNRYTTEGSAWLKAEIDQLIKTATDGPNITLFLGCVIPNRYPFIDAATRHVLNALNVGVVEMEGAGCCPAPGVFRSFDINTWLTLGARNITIAEDLQRNIGIMCNGCYGTLNDINTELKHNKAKRDYVNDKLQTIGKTFKGNVDAEHIVWVLYHDIGIEAIKKHIVHKLNYKVAVHYGCHIVKPIHNKPWKDDFEEPKFLDELVEITGCTSMEYRDKLMCCGAGGGLRGSEKEISLDFTREKIENMRQVGVDLIVDCCPFCHLQLDLGQMEINSIFKDRIGSPYKIPVIYITQLLGLAMGIDPFRLGLLRTPQMKGVSPFSSLEPIFTTLLDQWE